MELILLGLAVVTVLALQAWQLVLVMKLQIDVQKFGRLLRKLRNRGSNGAD